MIRGNMTEMFVKKVGETVGISTELPHIPHTPPDGLRSSTSGNNAKVNKVVQCDTNVRGCGSTFSRDGDD
jgi:hypothetical protein